MDDKFLLVLFYSASGSVKNLAHAISDGAEEYGLKVKIRMSMVVSSNMRANDTPKRSQAISSTIWMGVPETVIETQTRTEE